MSRPTRQRYEQAVDAGESARRAGRKRESCPLYGMGEESEILREAWYSGYDRQDERQRAKK